MTTNIFDPSQYKSQQRHDWDAVARGWQKWWRILEKGAQPVSDKLIELAGVQAGHRVLDVATGIGEPALSAARRVGVRGRVLATDQSPQMLNIARERIKSAGLSNVDFLEMDGEQLAVKDKDFDTVLCRWGLMFFPDTLAALQHMASVLKPGGRLAAATWGVPPKVPMISLAMGVVREMLQAPPPPSGMPGPFSLADTARMESLLKEAGFSEVHSETMPVIFALDSAEQYTQFTKEIAAPIAAMLEHVALQRQVEIWNAVTEAVRRFADKDGAIRMPNEAICFSGRV